MNGKKKETGQENEERLGGHQFQIASNFLQVSFSLLALINAYVESSSLLATVARRESSKLSSPIMHAEELTFTEKRNISVNVRT